jgi:hypothetical protein
MRNLRQCWHKQRQQVFFISRHWIIRHIKQKSNICLNSRRSRLCRPEQRFFKRRRYSAIVVVVDRRRRFQRRRRREEVRLVSGQHQQDKARVTPR